MSLATILLSGLISMQQDLPDSALRRLVPVIVDAAEREARMPTPYVDVRGPLLVDIPSFASGLRTLVPGADSSFASSALQRPHLAIPASRAVGRFTDRPECLVLQCGVSIRLDSLRASDDTVSAAVTVRWTEHRSNRGARSVGAKSIRLVYLWLGGRWVLLQNYVLWQT